MLQPAFAASSGYYNAREAGMGPLTSLIGAGLYEGGFMLGETTGDVLNTIGVGADKLGNLTGSQALKDFGAQQAKTGEIWDSKMSEVLFSGVNKYKTDTKDYRLLPGFDDYMNNLFYGKTSGSASGGIGTKESLIHAFEGDKAEAVIPLESQQGVDYLANALQQAGAGDGGGSSSVVVNVNLSGLNLADNDAQWERVGRKISEVIEIQTQRRGKLSYGSK
jgi:hypothetical protein